MAASPAFHRSPVLVEFIIPHYLVLYYGTDCLAQYVLNLIFCTGWLTFAQSQAHHLASALP